MLFTYNKELDSVEIHDETKFKNESILERQHIEEWIKKYPEILGEELLIITSEYDKFDKTNERLDLLALDTTGKLVIIELKRDDSGKHVDLQAIKYAAYCSTMTFQDVIEARKSYLRQHAQTSTNDDDIKNEIELFLEVENFEEIDDKPRIIIVANHFRSEVMASILWLRNYGVDISCIALKPYSISENKISITANKIIPLKEAEEYQMRVEQKEIKETKVSSLKKKYQSVWLRINQESNYISPLRIKNAELHGYHQILTGIAGIHYEYYYQKNGKILGVELHFEKSDKEQNLDSMLKVLEGIALFKENTKGKFFVMENWGRKWCRFGTQIDSIDKGSNDIAWALNEMESLIKHTSEGLNTIRNN